MVELERERRRRNLIPARLGIYSIFVFAFHQISEQIAYNAFRRSKVNDILDNKMKYFRLMLSSEYSKNT